jgi:hypothetical protein
MQQSDRVTYTKKKKKKKNKILAISDWMFGFAFLFTQFFSHKIFFFFFLKRLTFQDDAKHSRLVTSAGQSLHFTSSSAVSFVGLMHHTWHSVDFL